MNWRRWVLAVAVLGMSGTGVFGQGAEESDAFRAGLQPQGYVSDWAEVFTPEQKADLTRRIEALKATNGAELAVVTLKSLKGGEIDDFASKLYEQWGIGEKGKDNGVLLLTAIEDRKVRIEPGYGMEGVLNDARCGRILDERVLPRFKEGNHAQGLIDGADALLAIMGGEAPDEAAAGGDNPVMSLVVVVLFLGLVIWILIMANRQGWKGGGGSGGSSSGWSGGGGSSGGGGFGGFGGGRSGGGGASRSW